MKEGPRTKTAKRKQQRRSNPYAKSAFLSDWSDDDDFQLEITLINVNSVYNSLVVISAYKVILTK